MKHILLFCLIFLVFSLDISAQYFTQYFDGKDTLSEKSINIVIENTPDNIWQIGPPQKMRFDKAHSMPNVLVTDTINNYPLMNRSRFQFHFDTEMAWGVMAVRWTQKLDMEFPKAGGMVEYSVDSGNTWLNVFDNPNIYNFYGFQEENVTVLKSGETVFSGQDTLWRDIWLCFDYSFLREYEGLDIRFTFISDSSSAKSSDYEGWMLDNFMIHHTQVHTISQKQPSEYLQVYPNPVNDRLYIEAQKQPQFHIIREMSLIDAMGRTIDQWHNIPTKYFIDTQKYSPGSYTLRIQTNLKIEAFPVIIQR